MATTRKSLKALGLVGTACLALHFTAGALAQDQPIAIGLGNFPTGLGNPYSALGSPASYTFSAMFDALTAIDEEGSAGPWLAESWENVDPTTWHLTIRQGVTFANGESLDAKAVAASANWLLSDEAQKFGNRARFELKNMISATAEDSRTVVIKTKEPAPILPSRLSVMKVVPPKRWADLGVEGFSKAPLGSGPFQPTSWTDNEIKLDAYAGSWRKPKLTKLSLLKLPERSSRLQAFLSGQIHIMQGVSPDNVPQIEAADGQIVRDPTPSNLSMAFIIQNATKGVDNKPLQDRRVRQALNLAVDKDAIVDGLLGGLDTVPSASLIPRVAFGYDPTLEPYPYDPNKAKHLLSEAGYQNGFDLTVEMVLGGIPSDAEIYQQVAQDLGQVGVRVKLQQAAFPDYLKKLFGTTWDGAAFVSVNDSNPSIDGLNAMRKSTCIWPKPFYCDQAEMSVINQINTEFDLEKRRSLLQGLARKYHEEATHLFLFENVELTALASNVRGFENTLGNYRYEDLRFE